MNKEHFLSALQNGGDSGLDHFHVVYHMDHCNPRSIGTSCKDKHEYMYVQDVDNLKNGGYPQIVISGGCEPAQFTENCIVEHFLTSQKGGAVAFIGNANVGWSSEHKQYKKFLKSLYNDGFQQLGILYGTMLQNYRDDYYRLHLLGDPEMPVWSAVPKNLEVNVTPTQMEAGTNTITVQIANLPAGEEATLCLMKDIEAYTVVTVNDTKPHSFTFGPKMPGDIKVTVTARNFIPFEGKIPVQRNNGNAISIVDIEKFDGTLYGGGTYNLNIGLRDDGRTSAYNVSAKLSTSSPYVTIVKDSVYYGLLHEFYTVRGKSDFTVKVSSQAPDIDRSERNAVCFFLSISRDGTDEIEVDTFKVDLKQLYQKINYFYIRKTSDGDLIPEPGETVWVNLNRQYEGNASLLTNTVVPVDTAMAKIPDGEQNALNRRVIISKNYKTGDPLRLKYTFRTDGKATDSLTVDIARQAASPDLSQIHTQSESDAISLYWDKMDSTNLYNVYRSLKEDGTYVQLNKSPISTRYYKDETAGALTEYYYKLGLVADDYFEMGRSEAVRSWTTYPTMGMFPLSMDMSRQYVNEANTADFDYDGQKEIILTGRNDEWTQGTLAVIRPDGTEPYDIDGNATSYSGFANISCKTEAVPAVADLKGDGEPCIISLTRNYNNSNDSVICFSSLDKNGDKLPDILWKTDIGKMSCYRGAVVTDIDVPDLKGEKEIIFRSEFSQKPVVVMDADGQIKASFGNFTGDFFGGLAVADLDGDGYKEIICGDKNGSLYVWRHDGTPYKQRSPFFSRPGQMLNCSPVVCDLDGDGEKEILITTRSTALSQIFAIKQDGSCVGSFDTNSTEPATIPYVTHGIEHALSVGDVNKDGNIEVVALGHGCVRVWSHTGDLLTDRDVPGLFPESGEYINVTAPILADVDGDETSEIVFHQDNLIYALRHDGTDVKGFPITAPAEIINGVCVSDMDGDGKNEIIAADLDGNISAWKTDGKSTTIEWGRARFDTGFTGEYVPHYEDPKVITASAEWEGGTFTNDIIVRAGTFRIASGKNLQMREGCRILVLEGGTLEVDGGTIDNADVSVKAGGTLDIKNNGVIHLNRFGKIEAGKGATVNALYGEVQTAR
ncbi:MAG: FG-GAP-like repeat-containing protein [Paraprevotella sp.]|nr:FG-GAP-like repeat-containing protein [Paraprevotella sp.]